MDYYFDEWKCSNELNIFKLTDYINMFDEKGCLVEPITHSESEDGFSFSNFEEFLFALKKVCSNGPYNRFYVKINEHSDFHERRSPGVVGYEIASQHKYEMIYEVFLYLALPYKPEYYFPNVIRGLIEMMVHFCIRHNLSPYFICEMIKSHPDQKNILMYLLYTIWKGNDYMKSGITIYPIFDMIINGEIKDFSKSDVIEYLHYVSNFYYRHLIAQEISVKSNAYIYKNNYITAIHKLISWSGLNGTPIHKSITYPWYYCFKYRIKLIVADNCEKTINIDKHYIYRADMSNIRYVDNVYVVKYLAYDRVFRIKFGAINTDERKKPRIFHEEIIDLNHTYPNDIYFKKSMENKIEQTIGLDFGQPTNLIGEIWFGGDLS